MTTRIALIDGALMRIGAEPLQVETAQGAETHIAVYDSVLRFIVSAHPWSFTTVTRRLSRLTAAPSQHWNYQYQMPTDMIGGPRAVFKVSDKRQPFHDYELVGSALATNEAEIWLQYQRLPEIVYWPGYFVELLTVALMAEYALSVREDAVLRERLRGDAFGSPQALGYGGLMGLARAHDGMSKPSPSLSEGESPLIDARYY